MVKFQREHVRIWKKVEKFVVGVIGFIVLICAPSYVSGQQVSLPPIDLGLASFMDGVGGHGGLFRTGAVYYHSSRINGEDGKEIPGDNSVEALGTVAHVAYLTKYRIFGGFYGFECMVPYCNNEIELFGREAQETGFGDLGVGPFMIQWVDHKIFNRPFFHRLLLGAILPTGKYSSDSAVNIGSNVYSINPYYTFTYFITPKLETSCRFSYLWNSKNNDPNKALHVKSIQPGQAFYVNYAASYKVLDWMRIGISGYYLDQISSHKVNGHSINGREEVFGIGPGFFLTPRKDLIIIANAFYENGAENRTEGTKFAVQVLKRF